VDQMGDEGMGVRPSCSRMTGPVIPTSLWSSLGSGLRAGAGRGKSCHG
jgi:hypothetical protein